MSRGLGKGVRCHVADNSGAKVIQIFGHYKGAKTAKLGEIIKCSVKKADAGGLAKKKEIHKAVIVRTNYKFRANKMYHIKFSENSVKLITVGKENNKGVRVRGVTSNVLAKEMANEFDGVN